METSPQLSPPPRVLTFAEARSSRRCQLCWRQRPLRKVGLRRVTGYRWTRVLVCDPCLADELHRPGLVFLFPLDGG
jgi:hypothetical protein